MEFSSRNQSSPPTPPNPSTSLQVQPPQPPEPATPQNAPSTKRSRRGLRVLLAKRGRLLFVAALLLVGGLAAANYLLPNATDGRLGQGSSEEEQLDPVTAPEFKTITPNGNSIEQYGGWRRISPVSKNAVFAYPDTVSGVTVNVSQQPLPDDFKTETTKKMKELADGFNAKHTFRAGETLVYSGVSVEGPQSIIFTKDGVLVLMKASKALPDEKWVSYIESMK